MNDRKKHVVITGAGRGIGAAIAQEFSRHDYRITLMGRHLKPLNEQITQLHGDALPLACDVTEQQNVENAFATAVSELGPIDVLVNNAGAAFTASFLKTSPDKFKSMMDVNLLGAVYCIQQVLPGMLERNAGRIINIGSTSSIKGYGYISAYSAAKHALMGVTRCIAAEISSSEVTINTVCPGFTETDIVHDAIANIMSKTGRSEEQAIAELTSNNPQGRFIQPQEVADQVFYLAEHAPLSVSGQAIMVDGGEIT